MKTYVDQFGRVVIERFGEPSDFDVAHLFIAGERHTVYAEPQRRVERDVWSADDEEDLRVEIISRAAEIVMETSPIEAILVFDPGRDQAEEVFLAVGLDRDTFANALGYRHYEALMAVAEPIAKDGDVHLFVSELPDGRWAAWDDAEIALDRVKIFPNREAAAAYHEDGLVVRVRTDFGHIVASVQEVYLADDFDEDAWWEEVSATYTRPQDAYSELTEAVADALAAVIVDEVSTSLGVRSLLHFPSGRRKWLWADPDGFSWYEEDEFGDPDQPCPTCRGAGYRDRVRFDEIAMKWMVYRGGWLPCPECGGSGNAPKSEED